MTYPLACPPASSGAPQGPHSNGDFQRLAPTKDPRSPERVSRRQLAVIAARLSGRDHEVMDSVSRFRIMSAGQLQRLFWPEGSAQTRGRLARHGLTRLAELGVLSVLERRIGGIRAGSSGRLFALGLAGQRLHRPTASGRVRRAHTPGERYLAHQLAVGELYVKLTEAQRQGQLELLAFDPEPACWRTYLGPWGARLILKPDAFCKVGVGEFAYWWFVEMDMATESLPTIHHKLSCHLDYHQSGTELRAHGVAPRVAWIVPDEQRAAALKQTIEGLSPDKRKLFAIATTGKAPGLLQRGVWS